MTTSAPPWERPAPPDGKPAFYNCAHGPSNVPCKCHYRVDEDAETMPDDWHETYVPPEPAGLTDELVVDAGPPADG